jgi:quercetin dioxygenase-like cupin family protein
MQALNVVENPSFEGDKASKIQVVKSNQIGVDALSLRPGQSYGPHRLPDRDRAVITLSGKGELVLHTDPTDERIELTRGMIALASRNTWHAIINTGSENLILALTSQFPTRVEERG